jgi:hypothetical protein
MNDIEYAIKVLKDMGVIIGIITAAVVGITGLITAIAALAGKLKEVMERVLKPLWKIVLWPLLRFVLISLTLIIPNTVIVWWFIYWLAEYLTPIIRNTDVFLFVVTMLAALISVYSLFWGMWLYPVLIRRMFNRNYPKPSANINNSIITNQHSPVVNKERSVRRSRRKKGIS